MRISLVELARIEDWYFKRGEPDERLLTEAKLLSSPALAKQADWQLEAYDLIRSYGRDKLLQEVKEVESHLFHTVQHKSFQQRIRSIFKF